MVLGTNVVQHTKVNQSAYSIKTCNHCCLISQTWEASMLEELLQRGFCSQSAVPHVP